MADLTFDIDINPGCIIGFGVGSLGGCGSTCVKSCVLNIWSSMLSFYECSKYVQMRVLNYKHYFVYHKCETKPTRDT